MRVRQIGLAAAALAALATAAPAQAPVTVGTGTGTNCVPFACNLSVGSYYQEIYAAGAFAGSGFITGIDFFDALPGSLNTMSFTISLSTTSKGLNVDGVGGISSTNPNGNDGADNVLFGSYSILGAAPATLSFLGSSYFYNPAAGNLLLDLRVTSITSTGTAFYTANTGDGTAVGRADNFASTGFAGYGLVTRFDYGNASVTPEPATMGLLATGLVGLVGFRRRRRA